MDELTFGAIVLTFFCFVWFVIVAQPAIVLMKLWAWDGLSFKDAYDHAGKHVVPRLLLGLLVSLSFTLSAVYFSY